ncbi:DNA-binding protein [Noviherbaspirillum sp. Root189]|nr:DNA-binding protein [Noviherbaspirillum sp. Root189]
MQAGELLALLGVSRPTMMRAVRNLGREIMSRGSARATSYAARRALRGMLDSLTLYRVDELGHGTRVGVLDPVYPEGCALALEDNALLDWPLDRDMMQGWFGSMPYPLDDMRPQGFLGRNFARRHANLLQVPENPTEWREDDILYALSIMGSDTPGNFILGKAAYQRFLDEDVHDESFIADDEALIAQYLRLAHEALRFGLEGSSAAGEFPKFTARRCVDGQAVHVLVKFSGDDDSPGTRRWADLLVCEHLALEVLSRELGLATATSRILQAGGRTFYESVRFDRHGARGRSGVCTWSAMNAALYGMTGNWLEAAERLHADGLLHSHDAQAICRIWHFGRLVANNDMHDGNLAFRAGSTPALAPVYDMLPMQYAPGRGVELPPVQYQPTRPLPEQENDWSAAARAALAFWWRAADDVRISVDFRRTCADNADALRARIVEYGRPV